MLLPHLTKLSSVRVYLPKDLRPQQNRKVVRSAIEEVRKRFPDGLPLLNPVKDMHISDEEFRKIVQVGSREREPGAHGVEFGSCVGRRWRLWRRGCWLVLSTRTHNWRHSTISARRKLRYLPATKPVRFFFLSLLISSFSYC